MFIQVTGAGVNLFRQLFQPLGIAPLDAFQRRQRTPVDLFIRLRHPRRQQPHALQQVANRVQRARPMRINMREKLAVTFANSLPARRFQRHKRPCQRCPQAAQRGRQPRRAVLAIVAIALVQPFPDRRRQQ